MKPVKKQKKLKKLVKYYSLFTKDMLKLEMESSQEQKTKKVVTAMKHLSFLYAIMIGIVISVFSMGASTVQAAEAQANVAVANEEAVPASQSADDGSSGVFLILGGMLIIIIAVVVTVVASVITTAPIADEI